MSDTADDWNGAYVVTLELTVRDGLIDQLMTWSNGKKTAGPLVSHIEIDMRASR